ncbi:MAG: xanthine dehydrogenase accessory protein XdhC [Proteobacteria bacterium]|nr:xanthine dehydrogenase accessory protein XdhC [Pseudomonadota bacterium]
MNEWIDDLSEQVAAGNACTLVTVAGVRGSAPREVGAKMLVTERETIGTIGGGQLEYKCTQIAVNTIRNNEDGSHLRKFTLGANCGQCCGGVVEVLFESFCATKPAWLGELLDVYHRREPAIIATVAGCSDATGKYVITADGNCVFPAELTVDDKLLSEAMRILARSGRAQRVRITVKDDIEQDILFEPVVSSDLNIAVFGAGHVGAATVSALSSLDGNIRWIDSRRNIFPERLPGNVQIIESDHPELEVAAMPAGACYLVMTHSHPLDMDIIRQILERDDFIYCGLIGSRSKRHRFEKRLLELGMAQSRIDKLTCPIGIDGIDGKKPAEIAIAVAAELLQTSEARCSKESAGDDLPDNVRFLRQQV